MVATDPLSLVFSALADSTRRDLLTRLAKAPSTVGELARKYSISAPAVSQHLKILERAGLITRTAHAQWRTIALQAEPLDDAAAWVQQHRREWNQRLDSLEDYVQQPPSDQENHDDRDT